MANFEEINLAEIGDLEGWFEKIGRGIKKVGEAVARTTTAIATGGASEALLYAKKKYEEKQRREAQKRRERREHIDRLYNNISPAEREIIRERLMNEDTAIDQYKELVAKYGKKDADDLVKKFDVSFKTPGKKKLEKFKSPDKAKASELYSSMSDTEKKQIKETAKDPTQKNEIIKNMLIQFGPAVTKELAKKLRLGITDEQIDKIFSFIQGGGGKLPIQTSPSPVEPPKKDYTKYFVYGGIGLAGLLGIMMLRRK